jgi:Outer membrane protein beta-barrel domain
MRIRRLLVLAAALGFGTVAFAQDYARVEVAGDYSYMRFNPENSQILSGFSLNGGGGNVVVYLNHWLGIEGDMQGYASTTRTFNFPPTASSPCPIGCTVRASGDLFTYNAGFVAKHRFEHFEPFVETLFGGAHTNSYQNVQKACQLECITTGSPSNNAFDFVLGGGIDIPITKSIAIRPAQFDFVLTRFGNAYTAGNNNQSNFRYNAGIVFRF